MKFFSLVIISFAAALPGCYVTPPPSPVPVGVAPGYAGYIEPVPPPVGVTIVAPIGVAPGVGWGWAYHPRLGWGWHNPHFGWRHR